MLQTHRRDWLLDLFFLIILIAIFYRVGLGSYALFTPDEGRYSEVAREMIATGDYITPRVNGVAFLDKPILYYWLQTIAIHLFGLKEWALRFFPMVLGLLNCIMLYICGRLLFNRRTAILSTLVLATTPLFFVHAHYANLDLEVASLISCALLSFITAVRHRTPSIGFLIAAYVFASFAFLTKGLIGIVFPILIIGSWILCLSSWSLLKRMRLVSGLLIFLVIVTPWYLLAEHANPAFLHYFFVTQQVTRFLSGAVFNNSTPFWFYLPIILIGFFPWTLFLVQAVNKAIQQIWQQPKNHATELFLVLWFSIVLVFFSIPSAKTIGYILPVFSPIALLVGHYMAGVWRQAQTKGVYWANALMVICNILFAGFLFVLPYAGWFGLPPGLTPMCMVMGFIFLISAMLATYCLNQKRLRGLFITCLITSMVFLLTLTVNASHLNQNSAKTLTKQLKTRLKPNDLVVSYFKYYQDVPLYLQQRINIVANWQDPQIPYRDNWLRELWYGLPFQNTQSWLWDEKTFWQHWNSSQRLFVFVNQNYLMQFKVNASADYYQLGRAHDIILLSNQP